MREILFRAQRLDNEELITGGTLQQLTCSTRIGNEDVNLETVGQFTGLTDKNGTNIFEGDILLYKKHNGIIYDDFKAVVLFKDGSFGFEEDCAASFFESFGSFDELDADILAHIEVIGNIHKTITP